MDNFNLKKYLVENKRTTNSRQLKEYIEDQGSITDAFTQAGINSNDTVTLRITADRGDTTLEPMSTPEAINYIESKAQGLERTYSFDDPEGDGAKLNINLSDDLAIDVYTADSINEVTFSKKEIITSVTFSNGDKFSVGRYHKDYDGKIKKITPISKRKQEEDEVVAIRMGDDDDEMTFHFNENGEYVEI